MTDDRHETLLDRDWGASWETLAEAPPLVPRPKTAQITLRIPARSLARIKAVAVATSLPYHAMARAWVVEGLRDARAPATEHNEDLQTEQVNLKVDNDILDQLKARAHEAHRPYHRLARDYIEAALAREEERLGIEATKPAGPPIKDLMVLLLHARNKRGQDAVHGLMRLQKLLFVIEHNLGGESRFYAYNYGPFNEEVNDAAHALKIAGFLRGAHISSTAPPSFQEMMATVEERAGPRGNRDVEEFALTESGHEAAESLRNSNTTYDRLFEHIQQWRAEWDTPDILKRIYIEFPKYTERSLIRDKVTSNERSSKRST